ncbi:hypothetical protein ADK86_03300 [Streptomyces sp. NRRL F-5755]|uniref:phage tail sheath family protein n=1 Tax=Streptomyces sp. NRRL F-5755 TaxID=1519475 RepID=UPI0006ADABB0|nr:phage tail sheath subtilisin-like domain-containing protein [Streptomyces sp. NRRL F-5755]KOU08799.1 hypothetical protein ADK86_03300 [Streptomyces sp. NRRL F-5755]
MTAETRAGGYRAPGVYREDVFPAPEPGPRTGVPAFLGHTRTGPIGTPCPLTLWPQFESGFGVARADGYLADAVRGFFENDGELCYVVRLGDSESTEVGMEAGLEALAATDTVDLICAPDIMRSREGGALPPDPAATRRMQTAVLRHCERLGDRFAILDPRPQDDDDGALAQRAEQESPDGALYYPWVRTPETVKQTGLFVPPCGHIAGLYAQTDAHGGVHRAPANRELRHVVDLAENITELRQTTLNPAGVNCLRALPGRGIRALGARTLSQDPRWTYVNVRRLFLAVARWIEHHLTVTAFEPNGPQLWARIGRELTAYLSGLARLGALAGRTDTDGFFVQCDAETNTYDTRAVGMIVTRIGLAPTAPGEFIVLRIVHGDGPATVTMLSSPADRTGRSIGRRF